MNNAPSDITVKATVATIVAVAIAMGLSGAYWAAQCGSHWFTYCIISFLPYTVPGVIVVYFALIWLFSQYNVGEVRHWVWAGVAAVVFFVGCFAFGHLQPAMPLDYGNDCQPF